MAPVLDMPLLKRAEPEQIGAIVNAYWVGVAEVMPEPFAPTTPNDSPGSTAKLTSRSACTCSAGAYWRRTVSLSVRVRSRRSL